MSEIKFRTVDIRMDGTIRYEPSSIRRELIGGRCQWCHRSVKGGCWHCFDTKIPDIIGPNGYVEEIIIRTDNG